MFLGVKNKTAAGPDFVPPEYVKPPGRNTTDMIKAAHNTFVNQFCKEDPEQPGYEKAKQWQYDRLFANCCRKLVGKSKFRPFMMCARMVAFSKVNSVVTTVEKTRPISVLPMSQRFTEKILMEWLEQYGNDPLRSGHYQSGFKKGRNQHDAIVGMVRRM